MHLADAVELRPDALFVIAEQGTWLALEVQLAIDESKRTMWPLLAAYLRLRHGAMGDVLVITPHQHVASWALAVCAERGPLGSASVLTPGVLRLGEEEAHALRAEPAPEMAFFAAWAMQSRYGAAAQDVAMAALRRADELHDPRLRAALLRSIMAVLSAPLAAALREMHELPEPSLRKGLRESWQAEALARGEARREAILLLRVLAAFGFTVDDATRSRVLACADVATLERWADRASTANTLRDVFED